MPHGHHPGMPQVTAVDGQFGTHNLSGSTRRGYKMVKKVLMCPPTYFDIEYSINP
jgi:hypothetical protein